MHFFFFPSLELLSLSVRGVPLLAMAFTTPPLLLLLALLSVVSGLDNGLGKTPPMNWSPWNHFTIHATAEVILDNARALKVC